MVGLDSLPVAFSTHSRAHEELRRRENPYGGKFVAFHDFLKISWIPGGEAVGLPALHESHPLQPTFTS